MRPRCDCWRLLASMLPAAIGVAAFSGQGVAQTSTVPPPVTLDDRQPRNGMNSVLRQPSTTLGDRQPRNGMDSVLRQPPTTLDDRQVPPTSENRPAAPLAADNPITPMPVAPLPIPGSANVALPVGGRDAVTPQGLPINLATAMQLAGVRPLDIATATALVEQALAEQLQAKVLWIPNLNAGVDYFRHDGVQQNLFTGVNFRKGRQTLFDGGGPTLFVGLADVIYSPLAARRIVASRRADVQTARNDSLFSVAQAFFELQQARGRLLGTGASVIRAEMLVNFTKGLAPSLIAPWRSTGLRPSSRAFDKFSRSIFATGWSPARGWPRFSCSTRLRSFSRSSRRSCKSRSFRPIKRPTS